MARRTAESKPATSPTASSPTGALERDRRTTGARDRLDRPIGDLAAGLADLQGTAGNRATLAWLDAAQPKLEVGAAGDAREREADAVARVVVDQLSGVGRVERSAATERVDGDEGHVSRTRLAGHVLTNSVRQRADRGSSPALQRLMTTADFKGLTGGKGRGNSDVSKLDKLLDRYAKLKARDDDLRARQALLGELATKADQYSARKAGGDRTDGVNQLLADVVAERRFVDPLVRAIGNLAGDPAQAFEDTVEGQDAYLEGQRQGRTLPQSQEPNFGDLIRRARQAMNDKGGTYRADAMRAIITGDLARLENMAADTHVDALMRDILLEVLANKDQVHFQETPGMASGAVLAGGKDRAKGITEKYRVDVAMEQGQGSAERMSSIVHELTHVATQEKFANTPIHLAFDRGASEGDILALSAKRTDDLGDLEAALDAPGTKWTPGQRGVLLSKIKYPVGGKNTLGSYATTFHKKGEITDTERDTILDLEAKGANNTLIEFDTVVNQMMFLMSAWAVSATDPFYTVLKRVAQEAYDYRNA